MSRIRVRNFEPVQGFSQVNDGWIDINNTARDFSQAVLFSVE